MQKFYSFAQLTNYAVAKLGRKSLICKNDPLHICLFVTDRCTLSCEWCLRQTDSSEYYSDNFNNKRGDMTLGKAKEILQYFPRAGHVSFAGFGEPLLVNDLFEINAEFRKRSMRTSMITNGTLLMDRMDDILSAGFYYLSVSLNSLDAKDYALTCGSNENTFNNVLNGIKLLAGKQKSLKSRLHISFVITRDIFSRIPEIIRLAESVNVDCLDLHNLIPHDESNDYDRVLTTDDEEVVAKIAEWRKEQYRVQVKWPTLIQKGLKKRSRICSPLWRWIGIDMEGNTAGCHKAMGTSGKFGNLFQEGAAVWNNNFRKKLRLSFLDGDKFVLDCCRVCVENQP